MKGNIKVRKVAKDVLMFIWHRKGIILNEPSLRIDTRFIPEISPKSMKNLCNAVWIQSILNKSIWEEYYQRHFNRMNTSVELFTKYVSFACYIYMKDCSEKRLWFFEILSLVVYFTFRCSDKGSEEFINTSLDLFCSIIEKEHPVFEDSKSWEGLSDTIEEEIGLRNFTALIEADKRSSEHFEKQQKSFLKSLRNSNMLFSKELAKYSESQVESNKKVVKFAASISDRMKKLCKLSIDEMLSDFAKVDGQVEEMYRKSATQAASGGLPREAPKVIEASKSVKSKPEKKEHEKQTTALSGSLESKNSYDNLRNIGAPDKDKSHVDSESELVRRILGEISSDISKLFELTQSLGEENKMQVQFS